MAKFKSNKTELKKTVDFFYGKFCLYSSIYKQRCDHHTDFNFLTQMIGFKNYCSSAHEKVCFSLIWDTAMTIEHLFNRTYSEKLKTDTNLKLRMLFILNMPFMRDLIDIDHTTENLTNNEKLVYNQNDYVGFDNLNDGQIHPYVLSQDYQKENYLKAFLSFCETIIK